MDPGQILEHWAWDRNTGRQLAYPHWLTEQFDEDENILRHLQLLEFKHFEKLWKIFVLDSDHHYWINILERMVFYPCSTITEAVKLFLRSDGGSSLSLFNLSHIFSGCINYYWMCYMKKNSSCMDGTRNYWVQFPSNSIQFFILFYFFYSF